MKTIQESIPHRAPFLLVDEIVEMNIPTNEGTASIRTRKKVDPTDPVFKGHFPAFPVLPGVLICEAIVQSGAILISNLTDENLKDSVPVLTRLNNAKFKQLVRPGDTLDMEARLKEKMGGAYFMEGNAKVNGKLAVSLEFACTVAKI